MATEFNKAYLQELAHKLKAGSASPQERADFEQWYALLEEKQEVFLPADFAADETDLRERIFSGIQEKLRQDESSQPVIKLFLWKRMVAAAVILVVLGIGGYFIKKTEKPAPQYVKLEARPGANRARLILQNGQTIDLQNTHAGKLAQQGNTKITKTAGGQVVYQSDPVTAGANAVLAYNTIVIPRGGEYQLVLPDGSKVWMNAASTLKYPVSFSGAERRVELTGEAYFQVSKNAEKPFIVRTATQEIRVLGTHFNVHSYADEKQAVTTLEEGSVRVTQILAGQKADRPFMVMLRPGQESVNADGKIFVGDADLETALAWVNGNLYFKSANLKTILREVSRWYDIEVIYNGKVSDELITGGISRKSNLSVLLAILQRSGIKFSMVETAAGKKLIVE